MEDVELMYYATRGMTRKDMLHFAHIGIDKEINHIKSHNCKNKKLKLKGLEIAKKNLVQLEIKEL